MFAHSYSELSRTCYSELTPYALQKMMCMGTIKFSLDHFSIHCEQFCIDMSLQLICLRNCTVSDLHVTFLLLCKNFSF